MKIKGVLLTLIALAFSPLAQSEIVLVTQAGSPVTALTENQLKQLYQGGTRVVNGVVVTVLDSPRDSELYRAFYRAALNKSPAQMRSLWARLTFTGKGTPPLTVDSASDLRTMLSSGDRTYLGYLDSSDVTADMAVVYRLP